MIKYILLLILFMSCSVKEENTNLTVNTDSLRLDSIQRIEAPARLEPAINDSLNNIAQIIAGNADSNSLYNSVVKNKNYINFSSSFSKRWTDFDTTRILKLSHFRTKELVGKIKEEKILFYPFSGPDILYANIFFPEAEKYILIGLEPVGSLPDFEKSYDDSLQKYYSKLNSSLHAILKFSFFRTESMVKDLRNTEVDGTIHLLFLFLNRTGNKLVSAKPVTIDSLGNKEYFESFSALKESKLKTQGVEICFKTQDNKVKELTYFSVNLSDVGLKSNKGFGNFLRQLKDFDTYLKGASYLLHKPYFSVLRNTILNGASTIVQDDSGISLKYFKESNQKWEFKLFGEYTKPISLFKNAYQKDLDSLYKSKGAIPLGFGIGYNFKDKNSNLLIATHN